MLCCGIWSDKPHLEAFVCQLGHELDPLPALLQALWRVAMTGVGIAIQFLAVTLLFPVTSHSILRQQMAVALGQLASAAEETIGEIIPGSGREGSGHPCSKGSSRGASGIAAGNQTVVAEGHVPRRRQQEAPGIQGSTVADAAEAVPADAEASPFQQVQQSPPLEAPATDVEAPSTPHRPVEGTAGTAGLPQRHTSMRRLQLGQQPSLVVLPPDPAAMSGGSRKAVQRAVRQLKAPVGPSIVADCEHLLGPMYTRLLFRAWQVRAWGKGSCLRQPGLEAVSLLPACRDPPVLPPAGQQHHQRHGSHHRHSEV